MLWIGIAPLQAGDGRAGGGLHHPGHRLELSLSWQRELHDGLWQFYEIKTYDVYIY